jgi:DNA-directed RNA polymerase subunit RPC12/RpoP
MTKTVIISLGRFIPCPNCGKRIQLVKAEIEDVHLGNIVWTFATQYRCIRPECNKPLKLSIQLRESDP